MAATALAVVGGCSSSSAQDDVGPGRPLRLLFAGDSITNGSAAPNFVVSYAPLAVAMLGEVAVRPDSVVGGYPGATSTVVVEKLRESMTQRPDLVVILAGINDASQYLPSNVTRANLRQAVEEVGAERCVVGIPAVPRALPPEESQALVGLQSWLVREHGLPEAVTVVDFLTALRAPDSVEIDRRYVDVDGVHPNALGHQIMARTLVEALIRSRRWLKAAGLVARPEFGNLFLDPLNGAGDPAEVWKPVGSGPSIMQGASYVPASPEYLRAGRWLEIDCATGPDAGTVEVASVPCDVSGAQGRRVVLCCQCEVEVVAGAWLEDVSSGVSGVDVSLVDDAGRTLLDSSPFQLNAGYVSETDARVVRWGPVAHPVGLAPSRTVVSIAIACRLAPNSRCSCEWAASACPFEDQLPAPSASPRASSSRSSPHDVRLGRRRDGRAPSLEPVMSPRAVERSVDRVRGVW